MGGETLTMFPKEVVDGPSPEVFSARLDGALAQWKLSKRGVGTGQSLKHLPIQTILQFHDFSPIFKLG